MNPSDVQYIAIHCAATKPDQFIGAKEIREWHVNQNGWADIGYHYVVRRNGAVEAGRALSRPGAHVAGYNKQSWGVCLVGGLDYEGHPVNNFTPEQFSALYSLLIGLKELAPRAEILGHRDFPNVNKSCPCFNVRKWWHETRE